MVEAAVVLLREPSGGDGLERIRGLLEAARDGAGERQHPRGCLMCNAAIDRATDDPAVRAQVLAMMKRLEDAFAVALADSATARAWPNKRHSEAARFLAGAYLGIQVLVRAGYSADELDGVIAATLQALG